MIDLLNKYSAKLSAQGLCDIDSPLMCGLDARRVWNRDSKDIPVLEEVTGLINCNSLLFACPAEPYRSILFRLAEKNSTAGLICPEDSETRTFLHDIPIIESFNADDIARKLKQRKSVIVKDKGIVTWGTVSPEQAFITFSSVCFSTYIKFCTDAYFEIFTTSALNSTDEKILRSALSFYKNKLADKPSADLLKGPYRCEEDIYKAITAAGKLTVATGMVDSFFGNISYRTDSTIYITQTGSSLDELERCIDPCPLDNSSTNAVTASSEFSAHRGVYGSTPARAILHGHPKFSVIVSMLCTDFECAGRGTCYRACSRSRSIHGIPIVPGEVGTGPTGISTTLPAALKGEGVIVYGHGLFTASKTDLYEAFMSLLKIEKNNFEHYCAFVGIYE